MTKEEAIDRLKTCVADIDDKNLDATSQALKIAIKALEQEPTNKIEESNFSQEQYLADIQGAYDCGKSILDKIRAEVTALKSHHINDSYDDGFQGCRIEVLDILDKYKAESVNKK